MSDNLNPKQFRWVPDQKHRELLTWHIMDWHIKRSPSGGKDMAFNGMSKEKMDELHEKMHADEQFESDKEHKHFTPKNRK